MQRGGEEACERREGSEREGGRSRRREWKATGQASQGKEAGGRRHGRHAMPWEHKAKAGMGRQAGRRAAAAKVVTATMAAAANVIVLPVGKRHVAARPRLKVTTKCKRTTGTVKRPSPVATTKCAIMPRRSPPLVMLSLPQTTPLATCRFSTTRQPANVRRHARARIQQQIVNLRQLPYHRNVAQVRQQQRQGHNWGSVRSSQCLSATTTHAATGRLRHGTRTTVHVKA